MPVDQDGGIVMRPIGIIRSPYHNAAGTPIQTAAAPPEAVGSVEVSPEFAAGLKDLDGFERIWLIYWFDRVTTPKLLVKPYLDTRERGVFATRAPARPNRIGMSPVRLLRVDGNVLHIGGVDILDGTPLLDIKPYFPAFDHFEVKRTGWYPQKPAGGAVADDRFELKTR
jgi:tRNA-Thr(GGU) m(6)t(6)A37 methyltransferase TsaA